MIAWPYAIFLSLLTMAIHYEAISLNARLQTRMSENTRGRMFQILIILFAAHVIEIELFALGLYIGTSFLDLGTLSGATGSYYLDLSYFSAVSYTSVGYGDIVAEGPIRLVASLEALVGLLMIAWSGAYTVYFMERQWSPKDSPDLRK